MSYHYFYCLQKELKLFYTAFLDTGKLGDSSLAILTEKSYNAMTANGDVDLRPVAHFSCEACQQWYYFQLSYLQTVLSKLLAWPPAKWSWSVHVRHNWVGTENQLDGGSWDSGYHLGGGGQLDGYQVERNGKRNNLITLLEYIFPHQILKSSARKMFWWEKSEEKIRKEN